MSTALVTDRCASPSIAAPTTRHDPLLAVLRARAMAGALPLLVEWPAAGVEWICPAPSVWSGIRERRNQLRLAEVSSGASVIYIGHFGIDQLIWWLACLATDATFVTSTTNVTNTTTSLACWTVHKGNVHPPAGGTPVDFGNPFHSATTAARETTLKRVQVKPGWVHQHADGRIEQIGHHEIAPWVEAALDGSKTGAAPDQDSALTGRQSAWRACHSHRAAVHAAVRSLCRDDEFHIHLPVRSG